MALVVVDKKGASPGLALVTERDYLAVLSPLLELARKSIDVLAFAFTVSNTNGRLEYDGAAFGIMTSLKAAAARGVGVRVYLESRRDTAARNLIAAEHLRRAGVEVTEGRTHAKGIAVDGRYVLFGSTNLSTQSLTRNNETNLLFDDARVARGFGRYFEHLWAGGGHGGVRLTRPWLADGAFLPALLKVIGAAERRLDFSIYYFHHPAIEAALIKAHARGVRITGLFNYHRRFHLEFVKRNQATVKRLRAAGVTGLRFDGGRDFTHSKYVVRDAREILLGTGNWVREDVEIHPQLYARVEQPTLARALVRHLAAQIEAL